jgi:hypothetical protein
MASYYNAALEKIMYWIVILLLAALLIASLVI